LFTSNYRKFVIVCILISSFSYACAAETTKDPYFKAVLDARLASITPPEVSSDVDKVNRVFDSIDKLIKQGKKSDKPLIDLLDYYIGEGQFEDQATAIIERGKRMIPLLKEKKDLPLDCLPEYKTICRKNIDNRNNLIDSLVDEINKTDNQ